LEVSKNDVKIEKTQQKLNFSGEKKISCYTNLKLLETTLANSEIFQIVDTVEKAEICWFYEHISNFDDISLFGKFVNQFPSE